MTDKLSERLEACAEEMESRLVIPRAHALLREAADLARRVEGAAVADVEWDGGADLIVYFDGCTDETMKGCRWNAIMSEKMHGQRVRLVPEPPEVG